MKCVCGGKRWSVIRTDHDADANPIRIRQCRNCKARRATEEREIPIESFFGRATQHDRYRKEAEKREVRICRFCKGTYRGQRFSKHCKTPEHLAALKTVRTDRIRAKEGRSRRRAYWRARGVDLDSAHNTLVELSAEAALANEREAAS